MGHEKSLFSGILIGPRSLFCFFLIACNIDFLPQTAARCCNKQQQKTLRAQQYTSLFIPCAHGKLIVKHHLSRVLFSRPLCAQKTVACPRAQAAGGHGPERKQRIDWMYEGPMQSTQDQQAEANEYLMGKEVTRAGRLRVCS